MNKKVMSFVLAMVLSVGLGVGSAFAYSYSNYADEFNESYAGKTAEGSVTINVGSPSDLLGGNLTAVFGYYAGSLVSYQGAGGQFQLYDSYGARFNCDNKGGAWNVSLVNLRASDYAKLADLSDEEFVKALEDMGFTKESLAVASMDKDGNLLDKDGNPLKDGEGNSSQGTGSISSEWIKKVKETLKSGVNMSATISVGTGMTGPSLTVSENGKTMATYQTDPATGNARMTSLYRYDDNGFLVGVQSATFEMSSSKNGTATGKWTNNYTAITYDANGVRTDTTYQFANWSKDPEGDIRSAKVATPDTKLDESKDTFVISKTTYSGNNSTLSSMDYTTNNITYYANNQASYVINEAGTTVGLYKYTANGVIQAYFNANGTDAKGAKVGTTTVYDQWGRQLFTATGGGIDDPNGKNALKNDSYRQQLINEYNDIIKNNKAEMASFEKQADGTYTAASGSGTSISSICIYADQILDTSNPAIMTNGFIDMKKVGGFVQSGNINGIISNNLSGFGYKTNDIINMLKFANGTNTALAQTQIAHSSWDENNLPEDVDVSGATVTNVTETRGTVSKSLGTHKWHQIVDTEAAGDGRTTYNGIQYTNTILLGGAQAYSKTHAVVGERINVSEVNAVMETDPAVKGSYQGTVEIDGKTYVKVSASEVNIMDGNGFQAADGETVLVDIDSLDEDTKNQIMNMKEGEEIMFMGDVRKSADGKSFTMAVNTNYSGGVAMGSDISKMREAIQNENLDWVKKNTAINSALIGDQNIGGDWKSGWNILVKGGKKDPKDHIPADELAVLF